MLNHCPRCVTYPVHAFGVIGVAVDLREKAGHDPQLVVVSTGVDIEVLHVVRRAVPPLLRMASDIVRVGDDWQLSMQ